MHNEGVREEQILAAEKVRQLLSPPPVARAGGGDLDCNKFSFDNSPSMIAAQTVLYHPKSETLCIRHLSGIKF